MGPDILLSMGGGGDIGLVAAQNSNVIPPSGGRPRRRESIQII